MIKRILQRIIYGPRGKLSPVEGELLGRVSELLGRPDDHNLKSQLGAFDFLQRDGGGRVVRFHFMNRERVSRYKLTKDLPNWLIAESCMKDSKSGRSLSAKVFTHKGFLSSIEYDCIFSPQDEIEIMGVSLVGKRIESNPDEDH